METQTKLDQMFFKPFAMYMEQSHDLNRQNSEKYKLARSIVISYAISFFSGLLLIGLTFVAPPLPPMVPMFASGAMFLFGIYAVETTKQFNSSIGHKGSQ